MCGFPLAQMDKFLEKLVRDHNRFVAICEEFKRFDNAGNVLRIDRRVVRVVTPGSSSFYNVYFISEPFFWWHLGTLIDEAFIEKQEHNFLLGIDFQPNAEHVEFAWIDTSTGELFTQDVPLDYRAISEEIARLAPGRSLCCCLRDWLPL